MTQPTTSTHLLQMTVAAPSISEIVLALVSFDGGCLPSVSYRFLTGGRRVFGARNETGLGEAGLGQSKARNGARLGQAWHEQGRELGAAGQGAAWLGKSKARNAAGRGTARRGRSKARNMGSDSQ